MESPVPGTDNPSGNPTMLDLPENDEDATPEQPVGFWVVAISKGQDLIRWGKDTLHPYPTLADAHDQVENLKENEDEYRLYILVLFPNGQMTIYQELATPVPPHVVKPVTKKIHIEDRGDTKVITHDSLEGARVEIQGNTVACFRTKYNKSPTLTKQCDSHQQAIAYGEDYLNEEAEHQARTRGDTTGVEVGDIFVYSRGCIEFYEVVYMTPKTVNVCKIQHRVTEDDQIVPIPGDYQEHGTRNKKVLQCNDQPILKMPCGGIARLWDGKPLRRRYHHA